VFFVDDDRRVYLELLKEQADKYSLELIGYCLMSNHIHIVAIPHEQDSLAKAVGRTHACQAPIGPLRIPVYLML
jgi:putative transposase